MSVGDLMDTGEGRPAYIEFEKESVQDKEASLKAGHHVEKDVDMVVVFHSGSRDQSRREVGKWFQLQEEKVKRGRIPRQHFEIWKKAYEHWKSGEEIPLNGTSVKEWNVLSPAQCKNLINAGCRTIEDVAAVTDEGLRRIGIGGIDLKNKAKAWLQAAKDTGPLVYEVSALQKENDQLKGSIESLQEQVTLLSRQLDAKDAPAEFGNPAISVPRSDVIPIDEILPDADAGKTPTELFIEKFGKKPHHKMKDETILKKLEE